MVILSKLNQKRLRNSKCKHAPFPKTRVDGDFINREVSRDTKNNETSEILFNPQ